MHVSEARLTSNRLNGSCSKGPLTPETKDISRQNSLKHGMTGSGHRRQFEGIAEEIRAAGSRALTEDMKPMSPAGILLIAQMATCSVRMETAATQESAATARNVRHAADKFDEEREAGRRDPLRGPGRQPLDQLPQALQVPGGDRTPDRRPSATSAMT